MGTTSTVLYKKGGYKMRYFLDTEFIERGSQFPIELISIGIVADDGREYYAISSEFNPDHASQWVKDNVIAKLETPEDLRRKSRSEIGHDIFNFIAEEPGIKYLPKPEFWAYYADYDWVVFCQIFGTMMNLPKGWPMYCRDIKQFCDDLKQPKLPEQGKGEHNALDDARWNKIAYDFLADTKVWF